MQQRQYQSARRTDSNHGPSCQRVRIHTRGYLLLFVSTAAPSAGCGTTTTAAGAGGGALARATALPPAPFPASDASAPGSTAVGDGGVNRADDDNGVDGVDGVDGDGGGGVEDDSDGVRGWRGGGGGGGGASASWPASHPQRRRCTHDRGASRGDLGCRCGRLHSRMPMSMAPAQGRAVVDEERRALRREGEGRLGTAHDEGNRQTRRSGRGGEGGAKRGGGRRTGEAPRRKWQLPTNSGAATVRSGRGGAHLE